MAAKKPTRPEKKGREGKQTLECPHCHEKVAIDEVEEADGLCASCEERVLPAGYDYAAYSEDDLITDLEDEAFEDDELLDEDEDDEDDDEEDEEEEEEEEADKEESFEDDEAEDDLGDDEDVEEDFELDED